MNTLRFFILLPAFVLPVIVQAQRMMGGTANSKEKTEALKLIKQAEKLWKDDKYLEAERLYYKANSLFPTDGLSELAEKKIKLGDIRGANNAWDELSGLLRKTGTNYYKPDELNSLLVLLYASKARNNFESGDPREGISATISYLELFPGQKPGSEAHSLLRNATEEAFFLEDKESLLRINTLCRTFDNDMFGTSKFGEFVSDIFYKILDKQFNEAEAKLIDVEKNKGGFMESRVWAQFKFPDLYLAKEDYLKLDESIKYAEKERPKLISKKQFDQEFSKFYGFIALHNKEYQKAADQFTIYFNRKVLFGSKLVPVPAKFKYYTKRAESYEGLKQFDKARKDYEAALIYNPDYEPALNGLARLEGRIITERKTDKIPPQIIITEPAATRGLIVQAAGNDVLIKGMAADPGGLKLVTINGEKVYSQEGGTFWGSIALKEGMNKVTVSATDFSGNIANEVFDIERPASASSLTPIPLKEGRNFAVLIGCQNYDDNKIPSLDNPIADAIKLKLILKNNYNYSDENIITLFNPNRSDFKKQFLELNEEIQPEDNLVIFYAGHGIWVEKEKKGYWMMTDAKSHDVNTWLPNKEVLDMIARLPARHMLLITDACFSGSVFKTRGFDPTAPAAIQQLNEKITRVAITSGNDTEVPDKSVFMKYLVKALSENKDKHLTAQKMFITQIIEAVMTETKTEPRYGTLELAGHVGGDYIFSKK